jgi:hypothetical protein
MELGHKLTYLPPTWPKSWNSALDNEISWCIVAAEKLPRLEIVSLIVIFTIANAVILN